MFGYILDSIPVVGHIKGAIHYITGDTRAGNKSMYEASRSTAVVCGGAAGALGGPLAMVAGAAAAGAATDTLSSLVTQKPQGLISSVSDIATDISSGKMPIESVGRAGLILIADTVGGVTGPSLGNVATKAITASAW